ncbi:FAD-dependent oxidoreductase [Chitinophaga varians]|uniref:FAD-dependent oxidoreductase n=1 Tax=Chitinophaga varians TaxID=2202339 RepID=UPI00165F7FF0|nr:FAD-dependent monooxygenase [Chitinophaga varians]MBC9909922.1 FAD-dependent monooxygenase [Chitinophaga varians]
MAMKVIIAGAGLGGLCLAQGLKKAGIDFTVYEKDAAFNSRTQGYRIRIDYSGQESLSTCLPADLYAAFENTAAVPAPVYTLDTRMQALDNKWVDQWIKDEREIPADLKADRHTLRRVLISGIEQQVIFDRDLTGYSVQPDQTIQCFFADGETVTADLLVIANGAASALTASCFPGTGLHDTGNVCIYGKVQWDEQRRQLLQQGTSVIFGENIAGIIDVMEFNRISDAAVTPPEDYLYWALIGQRSSFGLQQDQSLRLSVPALQQAIGQATEAFPAALSPLFSGAAVTASAIVPVRHSVQGRRADNAPVTVMGDAIHTMSPAAGLGANTALRDAAALTAHLKKTIDSGLSLMETLRNYEDQMLTYSAAAIAASKKGSALLYNSGE